MDADDTVRTGLCTSAQLGGFITSLPSDVHLNSTSIYTTPLKFDPSSFPPETSPATPEPEPIPAPEGEAIPESLTEESTGTEDQEEVEDIPTPPWELNDKRQWDLIEGITNGLKSSSAQESDEGQAEGGEQGGGAVYQVPAYTGPIHYKVPKTGYYCVGECFPPSQPQSGTSHMIAVNPPPSRRTFSGRAI